MQAGRRTNSAEHGLSRGAGLRASAALTLLAGCCVLAGPAQADGLEIKARAGTAYFENIDRKSSGGENDTGFGTGLSLDLLENGPRYEADVRGTGTLVEFTGGSYSHQFQGAFVGASRFKIAPNSFEWSLNDTYGRVLEDPLSNDDPSNIAYDNYFSTGPDLYANLSSSNRAAAHLRYGRSDYQSQNVPSNHFYSGELVLAHRMALRSEVSLHMTERRVEYEGTSPGVTAIGGYFELGEAFVRTEYTGRRGHVGLDLGATKYKDALNAPSAPLVVASWDHRLSRVFSTSLSFGTRYAETLDRMQRLQSDNVLGGGTRQDVIAQTGPLREKFADLMLLGRGTRTIVGLRGRYSTVQYDVKSPLARQHFWDANLDLTRRLTHQFDLVGSLLVSQREFANLTRRDRDRILSATLRWRLSEKLHVDVGFSRIQRDSTNSDLNSFHANTYSLMFVWTPVQRLHGNGRSGTQSSTTSFE